MTDFSLQLSFRGASAVWPAKFMANVGGRLVYTDSLVKGTVGFAGWMPYLLRQWPIALDKIEFKRYAISNGIPTPAACFDPSSIQGPFIIKQNNSSFGEGIRGPYLAFDEHAPAHALQEGEYYENFIVGHIAKAWCWGGECMAVHLHAPSVAVGDGQSTLRQLVGRLPNSRGDDNDWELIERLAAFCGIGSLDEVVPPGKQVMVEFRYGSRYEAVTFENPNVLDRIRSSGLARQFADAARKFAAAIPPQADAGPTMFTLDAMVDADGQVLFLEMNCNPLVHPDLYGAMLGSWVQGVRLADGGEGAQCFRTGSSPAHAAAV
jgi:hypothetical protein